MRISNLKYFISVSILFAFSVSASANNNDPTSFFNNFDDLNLKDQNGKVFTTNQLNQSISLFNFVYTGCVSVCSVQTKELLTVYQSLDPKVRNHIRFVSVSLDPIKDNPKKLKQFAQNLKVDMNGWSFISMNFNDLHKLASKITLFKEDHGKTIYDQLSTEKKTLNLNLNEHSTGLWLVDQQGHVRQRYVGKPIEVKRIVNELSILSELQLNNKR